MESKKEFLKWSNPEKLALWRKENKESILQKGRDRRATKAGYTDRFLERIKLRNPDTDIDREYLLSIFNDNCVICNKPFDFTNQYSSFHNPKAPSIDRIDSSVGYYKGNIQIIMWSLNRMKNNLPNEEFLKLWEALSK